MAIVTSPEFISNYLSNVAGIDTSGMTDEELRLAGERVSGEAVTYSAPAPAPEVVAPVQSNVVEDTPSEPVGGLAAVSAPSVESPPPVETPPVVDPAPVVPPPVAEPPPQSEPPPSYVEPPPYEPPPGVRDNFEQFTPAQSDVLETPADKPVVDRSEPVAPTAPIAPISEATTTPPEKDKSAETTSAKETATDTKASTTEPSVETKSTTSTLPTLTDYRGNQYDGAQVLNLARQLAEHAGPMSGGVFSTTDANIGFASEEANKLLGRDASTAEQVLLDMSRQLIQAGVTDLYQIHSGDIKQDVNVFKNEDGAYMLSVPNAYDPEGPGSSRELTPDELARVKTAEVAAVGDNDAYTKQVLSDFVVGRGVFAGDKPLSRIYAMSDPLSYTIGATYTGEGGTSYLLNFDPKTGKPTVTASGFSTSDAGTIMPIIMLASNFLMPGVGSALTSSLASAGLGQVASQVVSSAIISGITSGVMAEATGGDFGDGFLKGALTGAISAGVAPMIQTALPSDLSPMVSNALTKAGTAVVMAAATGKDPGAALTTSLLNSAVSGGLSALSDEVGLSTGEAKVLSGALAPVVTQLVTTGKVNDQTLINSVMMAGSTILANTASDAVNKAVTLMTGDENSSTTGALTSVLNNQNINDVNQVANGNDQQKVTGALSLLANNDFGNETANNVASSVVAGVGTLSAAANMGKKLTGLTKFTGPKVSTTKANLTGAFGINKAAVPKTALKTAPAVNASLAKTSVAPKTISAMKAPAKVDISKLTPVKTAVAPPKKVDVSKLTPVKQTAKIG